MPANTSPIFVLTPNAVPIQVSTANTARDGTGTLGTVVTAGANGTRIEGVRVQAAVTTTAGVVRLFITDAAGANPKLFMEILVSAITPSTTVEAFSAERIFTRPLFLASGQLLKASTHNAEAINVFALGVGDL